MTVKYRYIGAGEYLNGIPARDLSNLDWAQLTPLQKAAVENSPLYELAAVKKPAKKESD